MPAMEPSSSVNVDGASSSSSAQQPQQQTQRPPAGFPSGFPHKKGLLGRANAGGVAAGAGGPIASPTDNMMSPVTAKLNASKTRHFVKGKPTNLFANRIASPSPSSARSSLGVPSGLSDSTSGATSSPLAGAGGAQ